MEATSFERFKDNVFARLERVSRVAQLTDEERYDYERDLKFARDYNSTIATARREGIAQGLMQGHAEGIAQGREEGIAQGREEGIAQGREEGIAQGKEEGREEGKWEIAAKMLSKGLDLGLISDTTGIPMDDLKERFEK